MDGWTEALEAWLAAHEGPLGYAAIAASSFAEYVVPPLPGDTLALAAITLATTAGWNALAVYLALDLGAVAGGLVAYAAGRAFAAGRARPRWLTGPRVDAALEALSSRFAAHGAAYLAVNRFVPAMRAFFFVAAGLARLPWPKVALWGAVSAGAWNGLLLALGLGLGRGVGALRAASRAYGLVVLGALALGALVVWLRRRVRAARRG